MEKLKIEYVKVDELIPYINNPRKNDHAVDAVASSIRNFGFKNPIVIDEYNEIIKRNNLDYYIKDSLKKFM